MLVILISTYLMSAFFSAKWISDVQVALFTVTVLLAIRNAQWRRRSVRLGVSASVVVSVLMIVLGLHEGGEEGRGIAGIWIAVLLLLTITLLVLQILQMESVTAQSIYGAISVYLLIGLMYAALYSAMYWLHGQVFFVQGPQTNGGSNFQYFSFTTLTTLGYGDLTAAQSGGRAIAMLEAMTGQIFLATLVAKLVSSFRPRSNSGDDAKDSAS